MAASEPSAPRLQSQAITRVALPAELYQVHESWLTPIRVDRIYHPLRSNPRVIKLLRKVGFRQVTRSGDGAGPKSGYRKGAKPFGFLAAAAKRSLHPPTINSH